MYSGGSFENLINKIDKINKLNIYFIYFIYSGKSIEKLPVVPRKAVAEVSKIGNL